MRLLLRVLGYGVMLTAVVVAIAGVWFVSLGNVPPFDSTDDPSWPVGAVLLVLAGGLGIGGFSLITTARPRPIERSDLEAR